MLRPKGAEVRWGEGGAWGGEGGEGGADMGQPETWVSQGHGSTREAKNPARPKRMVLRSGPGVATRVRRKWRNSEGGREGRGKIGGGGYRHRVSWRGEKSGEARKGVFDVWAGGAGTGEVAVARLVRRKWRNGARGREERGRGLRALSEAGRRKIGGGSKPAFWPPGQREVGLERWQWRDGSGGGGATRRGETGGGGEVRGGGMLTLGEGARRKIGVGRKRRLGALGQRRSGGSGG